MYGKGREVKYEKNWMQAGNKLQFQLPHSCDNWIIGGVEEAKQLIADLQAKIKELEND